jgi:hypothetical protein
VVENPLPGGWIVHGCSQQDGHFDNFDVALSHLCEEVEMAAFGTRHCRYSVLPIIALLWLPTPKQSGDREGAVAPR